MSAKKASIVEVIKHYQNSIDEASSIQDEARLLHCIAKLKILPIQIDHLQETGIGKTVNYLRKHDGEVGDAAKNLVARWKAIVAADEDDPPVVENVKASELTSRRNRAATNSSNPEGNFSLSANHHKNRSSKDISSSCTNRDRLESSLKQLSSNKNKQRMQSESSDDKEETIDESNGWSGDEDEADKLVIDTETMARRENEQPDVLLKSAHSESRHHREKSSHRSKSGSHHRSSSSSKTNNSNHRTGSRDNKKHSSSSSSKTTKGEMSSRSIPSGKRYREETPNDITEQNSGSKIKDEKNSTETHTKSKSNRSNRTAKEEQKNRSREKDSTKPVKSRSHEDSDSAAVEDIVSPPSKKLKASKNRIQEIDSSMGTSFEDALGMMAPISTSKNLNKIKSPKASSSKFASSTPSSSTTSAEFVKPKPVARRSATPPLLAATAKLEPLDPKIALELPTISPNYRPMPLNPIVMDCVFTNHQKQQAARKIISDEEAFGAGISSKTLRTKVYSGIRSGAIQQVPSLFDLCVRVLQKNIDALEFTGGVPFEVLRPVIERATPQQLLVFENYNPYLMEDSDELWKQHCNRHYRCHKRQEMESWREMYLRCKDEQDERLNLLAENIKHSQQQSALPLRKTQLAYVDEHVKPPRGVQRKQEIFGTKSKLVATPAARVAALSAAVPNAARAGDVRLRVAAGIRDTAQTSSIRPRKAPLMQKTLQLMKGRLFKR